MKNVLRAIGVMVVSGFLAASVAMAQGRGPSTPEERARAVAIARALESDPFAKDATKKREWMLRWLIEIPDVSVKACSSFLEPLMGKKKDYSSELFIQSTFAQAAFVIENPEKATDDHAVYLAGLEGTLRMYESIRREKPKVKWEHLDRLITERDQGRLADFVRGKMSGCK